MKVYLDTSVPSALLDDRAPERRALTAAFWARIAEHEVYISDLVAAEIAATTDDDRRARLGALVAAFVRLDSTAAAVAALAGDYLALGAMPEVARADALHVAVATVHRLDAVLSWNLRHLVRLKTRRAVNAVNALRGYGPIEILTPPEL